MEPDVSTETTRSRTRVRAPALTGRGWLNTGGEQLTLERLRGKLVLLDFWTSCCVNCLHVIDELRDLEAEFADVLVVVGVHSPKFAFEAEPQALADAVERHGVHHAVLDDPTLTTWKAYAARAWPTLVVVDPQGYVVAQMSGEGHAHGLRVLLHELVAEHATKGTLHAGHGPYVAPAAPATALRFPNHALAMPGGTVLVSDTAHHQLVELGADLVTEHRRIGIGERGFDDGPAALASLAEPLGLALLPAEVAARLGYDVVVADSVNHALRGVRLDDGHVTTIAGTGEQLRRRGGGGPAREQALSTPWDVAWFDDQVVVAMAGVHQLWALDPFAQVVRVIAGTTAEGLRDGAAEQAWFAQTSGLAPAGDTLWFVDAETSALRWLRRAGAGYGAGYAVGTVVGSGLFDFGLVDGDAGDARLQHPLGLAVLPDASIALADTYNGAVRRYDPSTGQVSTLATGLAEPTGLLVDPADPTSLLVLESAAHRLERLRLPAHAQWVEGAPLRTRRPATDVAAGPLELRVAFAPPTGQRLDDRWGDPTRMVVSSTPAGLLVEGAGDGRGLRRTLVVADDVDEGVVHVSVQAAACDGDPQTGQVPEHAACHLYQQDWGIPVRVGPGGDAELLLDLRGV